MKPLTTIIAAGLAVMGVAGTPALAEAGSKTSGELFASQKGTLLEVKASADIGESPNIQYFARVRRFRGYDGKNGSFMQNELSFGSWHGLRAAVQGRLVADELVPQAGVAYSTPLGKGRVYAALTSSLQSPTLAELLMNGSYPLLDKFSVEGEQIIWANDNVQKAASRAHVVFWPQDSFGLGLAGEADYGKGSKPVYKGGAFLRLR